MNTTGRISESGYSGLCVDMFAETKCDPNKHGVNSTQQTHGSADSNSEDVAESHSQGVWDMCSVARHALLALQSLNVKVCEWFIIIMHC